MWVFAPDARKLPMLLDFTEYAIVTLLNFYVYNVSYLTLLHFLCSFCPAISHLSSDIISRYPFITMYCSLLQGAASIPPTCFFYCLPSFFCTAVCIACSQFEKLRARLLAIGQKKGTPELESAADCDQTAGNGQSYICQEMFSLMQEQLKECVSLHRLLLE